mmetsp:Transcript_8208/g.15852  ORF Transcript_8208/g.15852 Transcript_8208/m.15852 type:complete len:112 (-) Transcript_8208:270-605(-)
MAAYSYCWIIRLLYRSMLFLFNTLNCSAFRAFLVKGHRGCSANTALHVANPITWPYGEIAGVSTGFKVIGSIHPGNGLSASSAASTALSPESAQRRTYRSRRSKADHRLPV